MKNNKGFSFVELLVAVAILGIISLPIASSFALAAKTDAKAVHLSAMNDAADDVMLLMEEIETLCRTPDGAEEAKTLFDMLEPQELAEQSQENTDQFPKAFSVSYNGYSGMVTVTEVVAGAYYRIDLVFTHSIAGSPLEVHRKGLLKYD
jgi:prepilin-type N-terminal cleavage/methylation domain-containing protein